MLRLSLLLFCMCMSLSFSHRAALPLLEASASHLSPGKLVRLVDISRGQSGKADGASGAHRTGHICAPAAAAEHHCNGWLAPRPCMQASTCSQLHMLCMAVPAVTPSRLCPGRRGVPSSISSSSVHPQIIALTDTLLSLRLRAVSEQGLCAQLFGERCEHLDPLAGAHTVLLQTVAPGKRVAACLVHPSSRRPRAL